LKSKLLDLKHLMIKRLVPHEPTFFADKKVFHIPGQHKE